MAITTTSLFALASTLAAATPLPQHDPHALSPAAAEELLSRQPNPFVPNLGQWGHPARFVASFGPTTAYLEETGFRLTFAAGRSVPPHRSHGADQPPASRRGAALQLRFVAAAPATITAEHPLSGRHNYFLGNDASRWRTEVPTYGAARYHGLYPGIDVRCYGKDGHFEYDLELAPGADLSAVTIEVEGAERVSIDPDGALVIDTAIGPVRQPAPVTFGIAADGSRQPLAAHFRRCGERRFGFAVPAWRGDCPLVVDPGLIYSTTLSGMFLQDMAVGPNGAITLVGDTAALGYPTTTGAISTTAPGNGDCFVTQLDPSLPTAQQNRYTTYFGGISSGESATDVAIDPSGRIVVVGYTDSGTFPTTPGAFGTSYGGGSIDAFLFQLDPSLVGAQQLIYSTLIGGNNDELPYDVAVAPSGLLLLAGFSDSGSYPVTANAFDTSVSASGGSAVVTLIDPTQSSAQQVVYSTFLGGSAGDDARTAVVDGSGRIFVAGYAESTNFPTTPGAFSTVHGSPIQADAYLAVLDPSLPQPQQLLYSTLFGGNADDWIDAIAIDATGDVVTVIGTTGSANLPTTANAFQPNAINPSNGFFGCWIARFLPQQSGTASLAYASYLLGSGFEFGMGIAVGPNGAITAVGSTDSPNFPTTAGAYDTTLVAGGAKGFVTRLDPARPPASQLVYSTLIGGGTQDYPVAVSVDPLDSEFVTIAGYVGSSTYPVTPGAFGTPITGADGFVSQLDLRPTGVAAYGGSSPACNGPLAIGVMAWPQVGNPGFAFTCRNAPPLAVGALVLNYSGLGTPAAVLGIGLWVDPIGAALGIVLSDAAGAAEMPLPIPAQPTLAGLQLRGQFAFVGQAGPSPCPALGWSASNALAIVIQP